MPLLCVNDVSIQLQLAWHTVQTNCSVVHKVEDDYMYLDRIFLKFAWEIFISFVCHIGYVYLRAAI